MDTDKVIGQLARIAKKVKRVPRKRREAAVVAALQKADLWWYPDADVSEGMNQITLELNKAMVQTTLLLARDTGAVEVLKSYENTRSFYETHHELKTMELRAAAGP